MLVRLAFVCPGLLCCCPVGQRCAAFFDRSVLAYKHAAQASGFRDTHSLALRACIAGSKCFTAFNKGAIRWKNEGCDEPRQCRFGVRTPNNLLIFDESTHVGRERAKRSSGNAVLRVLSDAGTASLTLLVAGLHENQQAARAAYRTSSRHPARWMIRVLGERGQSLAQR